MAMRKGSAYIRDSATCPKKMKTPNVSNTGRAILCIALLALSSPVFAKTPQRRVESGSVQSIDHPAGEQRCVGTVGRVDQRWRVLRLQRYGAVLPMNLVWNSRTT